VLNTAWNVASPNGNASATAVLKDASIPARAAFEVALASSQGIGRLNPTMAIQG
jgi:hypothetical protein